MPPSIKEYLCFAALRWSVLTVEGIKISISEHARMRLRGLLSFRYREETGYTGVVRQVSPIVVNDPGVMVMHPCSELFRFVLCAPFPIC